MTQSRDDSPSRYGIDDKKAPEMMNLADTANWAGPIPAMWDRIIISSPKQTPRHASDDPPAVNAGVIGIPYSGVLCVHAADEIALNPGFLNNSAGGRPEEKAPEPDADTPLMVDDE